MPGQNNLWTIVVAYDGGTYISQYRNMTLFDAIKAYNSTDPSDQGAVPIDEPVAISGTEGVFCASGLTKDDELILANIIATEKYS